MLPVNYIEVIQQTPEWMEMRKGCVTGSMVKNVVARMKRQKENEPIKYQQCREDYMEDIITTRLTGEMSDRYVSKAMEDGIEFEPLAIAEYESRRNVMTESIGIVFHPVHKWYATSPDFLLGSDIVGEVKCPTQTTHMRYIREYLDARRRGLEYVPEEYLPQVKAHLGCTERPVCHFVSFHRKFPEHLRILVSPWRRDKGAIEAQEAEVLKFLAEAEVLEREMRDVSLEAEVLAGLPRE